MTPMTSPTLRNTLVALLLAAASLSAQAQVPNCIDEAKSAHEVDQCGAPLIKHVEEKVESEYKRLSQKFTGNEKMQEMIKTSRQNWDHYRNNQCVMEAAAATGTYALKPLSLEANKIYFKCMLRTFSEMKSSLEKF